MFIETFVLFLCVVKWQEEKQEYLMTLEVGDSVELEIKTIILHLDKFKI